MGRRNWDGGVSPLRMARLERNRTLEQVAFDLDAQSPGGRSGLTPSMLSGWELGRHVTSLGYRQLLCGYYGKPVAVLFAHQDDVLSAGGEEPELLAGHERLSAALMDVVAGAEQCLVVTGSRSRDVPYLRSIEERLAACPSLVHYRVLFGVPHHRVLKDHLLRLLEVRDPADRSLGYKTLHIGLVQDTVVTPERFVCASEDGAVVPVPSLTSAEAFDSGVRLGRRAAERLVDHVRQCYAAAIRLETAEAIGGLDVVGRPNSSRRGVASGR